MEQGRGVRGGGRVHNLLESRVDDVDLISTLELIGFGIVAHDLEQFGVRQVQVCVPLDNEW